MAHPPTLRGDVMAAYLAAACRIGAWAVVSAVVYRVAGGADFALLALIRGTVGILNYTAVGLSPAMIRLLAQARHQPEPAEVPLGIEPAAITTPPDDAPPHSDARAPAELREREIYGTGLAVAGGSALLGLMLALLYARFFDRLHVVPPGLARQAPWAVALIALGTLLRLFSDAPGALLQTRGRIALDNHLLAGADLAWLALTLCLRRQAGLLTTSITFAIASGLLLLGRLASAGRLQAGRLPPRSSELVGPIARRLLAFGSVVLLAQLAEYCYAPTDFILINRFLSAGDVAAYAPGVQIDMGLLTLVTGLSAVLLPRTALAHAAGNAPAVRRYFVQGTLASAALLAAAALGVWALAPLIFRIWFGAHPPGTQRILDLVLVGTVIGGSSAVGRSVLIGMGKVRAFTTAALLAGAANVLASYCFVRYGHLGLRGILYGTVLAVTARCALWMPWYVLRTLGREERKIAAAAAATSPA